MDRKKNKPQPKTTAKKNLVVGTVPVTTARRTITATLVLIAALLLGYILYDIILSHPVANQTMEEVAPEDEGPSEEDWSGYSVTEKEEIIAAQDAQETEAQVVYDPETDTYSTEEVPKENLSAEQKLFIIEQRSSRNQDLEEDEQ